MMRMAWGAALLGLALVARAEEPNALEFPAKASIEVDANGKAHVLTLETMSGRNGAPPASVSELIASRLRERIESWQFVPATRDGVAVPSRTRLVVGLDATDDGHGGLVVKVLSAITGPTIRERSMGEVLQIVPAQGMLLVADVRYAADGHVVDVDITDQRIFSGGHFVPYSDRVLKRGVEKSLKRWTFEPDVVAGQPIEGHGQIPLLLCMTAACLAAPMDLGTTREFTAADPAVKLSDAIVGTTL